MMPSFVNMRQPVVVEEGGGTYFWAERGLEPYIEEAHEVISEEEYTYDGEFDEDAYEDALREEAEDMWFGEYDPPMHGPGAGLLEAAHTVAGRFGIDPGPVREVMVDMLYGEGLYGEGLYAEELESRLRELDERCTFPANERQMQLVIAGNLLFALAL